MNIGASADAEDQLPPVAHCWVDRDGEYQEEEIPVGRLGRITFYKLNAEATKSLF